MAKARTRRKRSRPPQAGLPRWAAIGALLVVLAGAGIWYLRSGDSSAPPANPPPEAKASPKPPPPPPQPVGSRERFEFYDVLPDQEVRVGGEAADRPGDPGPPPVVAPGAYVIQAGAFPDFAEADKVKARLALLGVVAEIQQAETNGTVYHRVRIGPIENLDRLNQLRARLKQNRIEFLVIPVGE